MVELLLLAAALSADNFAVSIGYGSSNTRISPGMTALEKDFCSPQDRNGEPEWVRAAFFLWER